MPSRHCFFLAISLVAGIAGMTQAGAEPRDVADATRALHDAEAQSQLARLRAEQFGRAASQANASVDRTAQAAAAVAARIQQAEADIAGIAARTRLIAGRRDWLRADIARRQQPLVRLTAALELLARRPLVLALFRPGSVTDTMHARALIETMIPEVQRRTAALRSEIAQGEALASQLRHARLALQAGERSLAGRRQVLATLETRLWLAARNVGGSADREAERALAMSEQARDLGALVGTLHHADALRARLAALPGPVLRPDQPGQLPLKPDGVIAAPAPLLDYMLPLTGQLVAGFGDGRAGAEANGISMIAPPGGQAVAPAAGRVMFGGPFRGYGQIVIVAHDRDWTSVITGLARVDVRVGDMLVTGAPVGVAGPGRPVVMLELRHDGRPVNPLDHVRRWDGAPGV